MEESTHKSRHFDTQSFLYRSLKQLFLIIGTGLLLKFTIVDAFRMSGEQMSPTILHGDRLLVFRTPYLPVISRTIKPKLNKPVLFKLSSDPKGIGCLRTAAYSSDTVSVDSGFFKNSSTPDEIHPRNENLEQVLPESFSPRDNFKPYRVPAPSDTLDLDNQSIRDLFFSMSVMRQENPEQSIVHQPVLSIDDSIMSDYVIQGFTLYNGRIDSVPENLSEDWFFWTRLEQYLKQNNPDKAISLKFSVTIDKTPVHKYPVKESYVFLLADNWHAGLDSRYFGPVRSNNIIGRVFSVLWSYQQKPQEKGHIRINRFGRIIK